MAYLLNNIKKRSEIVSSRFGRAYERLTDRRVCIGITGLSRSGKTTLITSLLYQLLNYENAALAAFSPVVQGRVLGAKLGALNKTDTLFPFYEGIDQLAGVSPQWPQPTRHETSCMLELRLKPKDKLVRLREKSFERIHVEIRDYPGEWLMDIPMMGMSFQQWCHYWYRLLNEPGRKTLAASFLERVERINPRDSLSETTLNTIYAGYRQLMLDCREKAGFTLVQPGQLCFDNDENKEIAPFFPLVNLEAMDANAIDQAVPDSAIKVLKQRYDHYVENNVKSFVERCLKGIDRQLVLIDVVGALSQGSDAFQDVQQALVQILQTFSYGKNNLLSRLFKPKVEKLFIASTKVDQVLPGQHDSVRQLTSALVKEAYRRAIFCNIPVNCEAIAIGKSIHCISEAGAGKAGWNDS